MFGDSWEPAQAKIVAKKFKAGDGQAGSVFDFVADIHPDSGAAPFRTVLHEPIIATSFLPPSVGATVRVHANVKKQKAKFDKSDPGLSINTSIDAETDEFDVASAAPVGTSTGADATGDDAAGDVGYVPSDTVADQMAQLQEIGRRVKVGELSRLGSADNERTTSNSSRP